MGVYIRGMKMPKCCSNCEFHWEEDVSFDIMHTCQLKTGYIDEADIHSFPYDCPLVEVPEPHGSLIDKEVLSKAVLKWLPPDPCGKEEMEYPYETDICVSMMMEIEEQPTVIEAEGE